jgi:hypothetical protein
MERGIDTNPLDLSTGGIDHTFDPVCLDCAGTIDLDRVAGFNADLGGRKRKLGPVTRRSLVPPGSRASLAPTRKSLSDWM